MTTICRFPAGASEVLVNPLTVTYCRPAKDATIINFDKDQSVTVTVPLSTVQEEIDRCLKA